MVEVELSRPGTAGAPLRVAVVGSGPTGYYVTQHLLKEPGVHVEVDMFDRLPTPYGLVRGGVAPDHQKTKSVIKSYEKSGLDPRYRFFGNVEVGRDLDVAALRRHYHQIVFTTGAETDQRMGIPGEDLTGSHTATEFVGWYNGHPDYRELRFDLSPERAVIVGVGNVAVDVARILCRTQEELARTDIAEHALEALAQSRIREVVMLGRRGVAQAAFTTAEVEELGELPAADVVVLPEEAALDEPSRRQVEADKVTRDKVAVVASYAARPPEGRRQRLVLRFLVSPLEIHGDHEGQVRSIRLVKNRLVVGADGAPQARATDVVEELPAGLIFRSIGYRGVAVSGVPFDDAHGVIPNNKGRIIDPRTKAIVPGEYAAGWIKRGARGVIGTNKPDALETVTCMLQDLASGSVLGPRDPSREGAEALVRSSQPRFFSFGDWRRLDEIEVARGKALGRPRVKFTRLEEMLAALEPR